MIKIGARQNYKTTVCFAGSRPAMIMLALAPPSIAVVSFDHLLRDSDSACRDRPTGLLASSVAFQTGIQRTSATDRQHRNPHSV
jgi:hypothetical protein